MGYHLLTGATGLLGSYLLRDYVRAGMPIAVLVRRSRMETAQQRIETLMTRWEKLAGHALPRPVVLEGSLGQDHLGLSAPVARWVAENCSAFIHNAASLTFEGKDPQGEPWRSNIGGTRRVLDFCRETGIREFHYVSTAYVCGQRRGRILETELDLGQELSNDYERSKVQTEKMVHEADFLDRPTIYRPAIIIGDSRTGHTTTFHGFYHPLKLVHTMMSHLVLEEMDASSLLEALNVEGNERKNLVPVDWVSEVMAYLIPRREHHGKTYHLTPTVCVNAGTMRDVMVQAFLTFIDFSKPRKKSTFDWQEFTTYFKNEMRVYRSYWQDDPVFDGTHTQTAAPHLPCPAVDGEMLLRMCKFAIDCNFGWPKPAPVKIEINVEDHLRRLVASTIPNGAPPAGSVQLGLQVNGVGGGSWELSLLGGRIVAAQPGVTPRCTASYYLNAKTFEGLARREATVDRLLRTGQVLIEGNGVPLPELTRILQDVAAASAAPHEGRSQRE